MPDKLKITHIHAYLLVGRQKIDQILILFIWICMRLTLPMLPSRDFSTVAFLKIVGGEDLFSRKICVKIFID